MHLKTITLLSALAVLGLQQARAQVTAVNIGTGLPPSTLGTYTMTSFDPGPIAGESYYSHETAGNWDGGGTGEWNTWGQNYTGNVYVEYSPNSLTLTLSGSVEAVDFYEEPQQFANFYMTATDSSGATVTTLINGDYGSSGIGFYEDVAGGPYLTSITVSCTDPTGFAIGEFGINGGTVTGSLNSVPDTGSTLAILALGLCGLVGYSRFARAAAV